MTAIPHGTLSGAKHHGCKCLPCSAASAAWQAKRHRQVAYGTWQPFVDAEPTRRHIEHLHSRGMTWEQIADAAGVRESDLDRIRMSIGGRPRTERIRPERERQILAVQFTTAPASAKSNVPALGSIRRLRALRANGWSTRSLAAHSGLESHTIGTVLSGRQALVQATTAQTVVELYEFLHDQDPRRGSVSAWVADRTARAAEAADWAPSRAWAGRDLDDPMAEPSRARGCGGYAVAPMGSRQRALVEDTAELVRQGLPRDVISARLGVTWSAVQQAHSRCGVPMPELAA